MLVAKAVGLGKVFAPGTPAEHTALSGFYATLETGKCLAVLGTSGAGKSTLCRLLVGLLTPTQGGIQYLAPDGTPTARPPCGYLAPGLQPPLSLTPREWIHGWCLSSASSPEKASLRTEEIAGRHSDLGDWDAPSVRLSPRGRWALWRVQVDVLDPVLVVIDDPVSAGDGEAAGDLDTWLRDLKSRGKAICWATAHPERVEPHADSVLLLDRGHAVAKGTIAEWKQKSFTTTLEAAVHWHLDQHRSLAEDLS